MAETKQLEWVKVLDLPGLDEGRVTTVNAGPHTIALSKFEGHMARSIMPAPTRPDLWAKAQSNKVPKENAGFAVPCMVGTSTR